MPVDFNNLVDDNGTNTTGTLIDAAEFKALLMGAVATTSTLTGAQNNWAPTGMAGHSLIPWAGASDAAFTGLAGGTAGLVAMIKNTGTKIATFAHLSGSSSAANQFTNIATSGPTPVAPGGGIIYRHTGTNWVLMAHEQGAWITPTYAGAGFTASAGTWTVDSGDVTTMRYLLRGKTLTVAVTISTSSVSTTPAELRIQNTMFGGFTGAGVIYNPAALGFQGATSSPTQLFMNATTYLVLKKTDSTNWAADTNGSYHYGEITFDVT